MADSLSDRCSERPPLAIVGISALFPGSTEVGGFWRDIMAGRDLIAEVPPHYWLVEDFYDPNPRAEDKTYCKRGAFLSKVGFDPIEFGIPPANLKSTDTSQLLALMVAKQVLEDASQGQFATIDRERISVILGVAAGLELVGEMAGRLQRPIWVKALREQGLDEDQVQAICKRISSHSVPWSEATFPGLLGNVVTGRIANRFDLGGTNCTTDAACASSFSALTMAANELYLGDSDLVITGGVDTTNDPFLFLCFSKTPALSFSNDCRPFSDSADGTMLGEGLGMVALRRLADAERDGDQIYAVIKGIGTSSDGRAKSVYAPRPEGQARALRKAYQVAGYSPETVELMEAHGTGTMAGDIAEFKGMCQVFESGSDGGDERQWCALGSIKSQLGHTKAAAGVAGLIKVALALHHKVLPPTIKVDQPDPKLEVEQSPFYLNTQTRPWIRGTDHPRRASVSSFGFGGTNFHVALEEHTGPGRQAFKKWPIEDQLVLLDGSSPQALAALCEQWVGELSEPGLLRFLARTSQQRFDRGQPARLAVVAASEEELQNKLEQAIRAITERPERALSLPNGIFYGLGQEPGKIAFLFSGQGSQYVGMGADLAMTFDEARRVWDDLAADRSPMPLHQVVFPTPVFSDEDRRVQEDRLRATEWAQPAIGAVSLSILAVLRSVGLEPHCTGGHSFGEVTALCAAGALTEQDLLKVARRRGQLMAAAAVNPGSMSAVVHPLEDLRMLLEGWGSEVVIANINGPRQVVLSGTTEAIEAVEPRLAEEGIQVRRLPVATAFHSPVVEQASVPFAEFLEEIHLDRAKVPVYANSEAAAYPDDAVAARQLLAQQIARPVRFAEEVEAMWEAGVRTFVEVGPGSVLTNLVGQILEEKPHLALSTDRKGQHGVRALISALGQLAVAGVALDLDPLWRAYAPVADPREIEKPKLTVPIDGVNHGKIYPPEGGVEALPGPNPPARVAAAADKAAPTGGTTGTGTATPVGAAHTQDGLTMSSSPQAPKPPHPMPPAGGGPAAQLSWLQTFQELQRQTAEAHAAYQRVMAESHMAFLRTAEVTSQHLHAVITGQPLSEQPLASREPLPAPAQQAPLVAPQVMPLTMQAPPVSAPLPDPPAGQPGVQVPAPTLAPETAPNEAVNLDGGDGVGVNASAAGTIDAIDFRELLLAVVAEKTGYPEEILSMEMGLEADLGIDSIKRVEILSALQERAPGLPEVDASQIPNLQTLGQVLEFLEQFEADGGGGNGNGGRAVVSEALPGPVSGVSGTADVEVEVKRSAVRETTAPASGISIMEGLAPGAAVEIIDDRTGVARALAERLSRRGLQAKVVAEEGVARLGNDGVEAILYLGGLRELSDEDTAIDVNREAFRLARQVARRFTDVGGVLVTVQDTGGDFGLSGRAGTRAFAAGLASLAKTAALEWDKARVKAIDLERGDRTMEAQAEAIERELFDGGPEQEVGLRADGSRTTLTAEPASIPAGDDNRAIGADDGSVLVVSGGGRGVTAAALVELARRFRPRIVLLGRTPLEEEPEICANAPDDAGLKRVLLEQAKAEGRTIVPAELGRQVQRILANREIRATLSDLQAAGSDSRYLAVSVTDGSAVGAALDQIRADWGPVTGVIHGAGVLSDKRIVDKTSEQFDRVFDTKVEGLRSLLRATAADPLRLICIYSSVAARFGNVGQCDYAMANEVLNRVAAAEARRRGESCVVRSIDWGPWEGGMVTPSLKAHFKAMGVPLIPIDTGTRMLVEELQGGDGPVEVIIGSPPPQGMMRPSSRGAQQEPSDADSLAVVS